MAHQFGFVRFVLNRQRMTGRNWVLHLIGVAMAALLCGCIVSAGPAIAQTVDGTEAMYAEAMKLQQEGRYAEATELTKRVLEIRERVLGPEHPNVPPALNNLAELYRTLGRLAEAEPLFKRSLAIREKTLGPDHPNVALALNNLGRLYNDQARFTESEPLLKRAIGIWEKNANPNVAVAINNLAETCRLQGRYADAEPLLKRSLDIRVATYGRMHPNVATALNNLGQIYASQGRNSDAVPLFQLALSTWEATLGPNHPQVATALFNLAGLERRQGQSGRDAEMLLQRSLSIWESALGSDHPNVANALTSLASHYRREGRYNEAERLYKRALDIRRATLGGTHPDVANALNSLAGLYRLQRRYADAEGLLRQSLAIVDKALDPKSPFIASTLDQLAELHVDQQRYADAEPLFKRSLNIVEGAFGRDHLNVAVTLNGFAGLYRAQKRYGEAELLFGRSLTILEKALGPEHSDVEAVLSNMAVVALDQGKWAEAATLFGRSTGIIKRRTELGLAYAGEAQRNAAQFWGLIKVAHRLGAASPANAAETFVAAQWAQGSWAAASLTEMSARFAKGSPALADLVRQFQDLVNERVATDKLLMAAKSEEPGRRKPAAEKELSTRIASIDTRVTAVAERLLNDFPNYLEAAHPSAISVAEVQAQLGPDEALVVFLDTDDTFKPLPEESFVWVVTKSGLRWAQSKLGAVALGREVAALRCGFDRTAWDEGGGSKCAGLLNIAPGKAPKQDEPLPFDVARAHALYKALFGEVEDLTKGKHLLIVPSGPLTQLPFQVLATKESGKDDYKGAAWLARQNALTVLPAVSSLKALRRVAKASMAPRPMIGIGNPLLDGPDGSYTDEAKKAQAKQRCPEQRAQQVAVRSKARAGPARIETRAGLADVGDIKRQLPLPDTADELCAVAQDVKADAARDVLLGARATEREVKRLSATGDLAKYRLVHFATHGFLAGDLKDTREPGLILTPPAAATEEDDGYLSASEIAALKLDADWVILSACNTAAGAATSAEALSGLARAFIYAGARALLVSHWEVYSEATVKLITNALREMTRDPKVGRAEALRRSMLALIDKGAPHEAHPAYWAPFVLVGEGAAGR